jgi:hypothetical protein
MRACAQHGLQFIQVQTRSGKKTFSEICGKYPAIRFGSEKTMRPRVSVTAPGKTDPFSARAGTSLALP